MSHLLFLSRRPADCGLPVKKETQSSHNTAFIAQLLFQRITLTKTHGRLLEQLQKRGRLNKIYYLQSAGLQLFVGSDASMFCSCRSAG